MGTLQVTAQVLLGLDETTKTLDTEIDYLEKAIPDYPRDSHIRLSMVVRYNKLLKARNWIAEVIKRNKPNG